MHLCEYKYSNLALCYIWFITILVFIYYFHQPIRSGLPKYCFLFSLSIRQPCLFYLTSDYRQHLLVVITIMLSRKCIRHLNYSQLERALLRYTSFLLRCPAEIGSHFYWSAHWWPCTRCRHLHYDVFRCYWRRRDAMVVPWELLRHVQAG